MSKLKDVLNQLKGILEKATSSTNAEMLDALKLAPKTLERETRDKL